MSFELSGVMYKKYDTVTKNDFKTRDFVLFIPGQYPQHIKFTLKGDRCELIQSIPEGWSIKVSFNCEGREWNSPDKGLMFFNSLTAWKIEVISMKGETAKPVHNDPEEAEVIDDTLF